jgi:hypothetical protein
MTVAPEWSKRPVTQWWKLGAAERAVAAGRRLVWTDDDLRVYRSETQHLAQAGALLLAPYGDLGLTPEELERIAEVLDQQ